MVNMANLIPAKHQHVIMSLLQTQTQIEFSWVAFGI